MVEGVTSASSGAAVAAALASGAFDELIGVAEGYDFDAKSKLYDLSTAEGRYELAKDASAFANASGGYLVVGLQTEKAKDQDLDVVSALSPVPKAAVSIEQYYGVVKEYVYPAIEDLVVTFYADASNSSGLLVLQVPLQHPDAGPFLICKVVEDGKHLKEIVAGFVQRQGDHNTPIAPRQLQERFKKGSDTVALRLGRIEDKLDALVEPVETASQPAGSSVSHMAARIADILKTIA